MSSHHIVRENQEPALLIQDFKALGRETLNQLLEWSPTIIVDEYAVDFLLAEEIKMDVVFSQDTSVSIQEQTKVFSLKDSFLDSAFSYLISNSYPAVNILCSSLDDLADKYAARINIVAFFDNKRYVFVKESYEKWMPKGEKVYVNDSVLKSYEGLNRIDHGIFETAHSGFFRLDFNSSDFISIGEDI